jgi:recombination protein RecA
MLGIGGIPYGTILEIFGPEQSGKTWLAYILSASCQEQNRPVLYLDVEGTLNPIRAKAVGLNPFDQELFRWVNEFDSGNQALEIVAQAATTGYFGLIVIDSVAALMPKESIDVSLEQSKALGGHARMMSNGVQKISNEIKNKETIVVFINQIRSANLGSFLGATEETTGGKALKFYSHLRIRLQARKAKDSKIYDKDKKVIGNMTQCKLIKTRYGMPFEECDFPIYFVERKRDPFLEFFTFAERRGIMKFANKYYRYPIDEPIVKEKEFTDFRDALIRENKIEEIAKLLGIENTDEVVSNIIEAASIVSSDEEDDFEDLYKTEEE